MHTFRKASIALALLGVMTANTGCKDFFKVNVDPLNPSTARLSDLLPVTQVAMGTYLGFSVNGLSQPTASLMQQLSNPRSIGTFQQVGDSFTNQWSGLYADMLVNNEQIITQGTAEQSWTYVGIAQIQKAFVVSQMVDMWGDIPYSEALKGSNTRAPRFDKDSEIYADLFRLIDEGIANLGKASARSVGGEDLMYGGDAGQWARLGRTLKLKLYNQIRLTRDVKAEVAPLLNAELITAGGDFELKYGASTQPDNRNLGFIGDYVNSGRENTIGVYFYNMLKSYNDPRLKYYFYNQATGTVSVADYQDGNFVTVRFGSNGVNASANNTGVRTLPGLYPIGGRFDDGRGGNADSRFGKGVVAQRLLTNFSRLFTLAELQLTVMNDVAQARIAYEEGIRASFKKVNDIAIAEGIPNGLPNQPAPTAVPTISSSAIDAYVTAALARFDNPAPNAKIKAIMTEKYIASFGYGLDAYTDFRRTGYPNITVPGKADIASGNPLNVTLGPGTIDDNDPQTVSSGAFPVRLNYQLRELQINPNAPKVQPDVVSDRIFWDKP